jgi:hypothetical protein
MTYASCEAALKTARNRSNGKPIAGNLRIFERHNHLAVQYYSTDIVRYYSDGSIEISTSHTQYCTLDKIGRLTGKWVGTRALPLFNKRKPDPEKLHAVDGVVFSGVNGYLRFGPDGKVDTASVRGQNIAIITNSAAIRAARKKAKTICDQLVLRNKLGVTGRHSLSFQWLQYNLDTPLDRINYDVYSDAPHAVYDRASPHWFAGRIGASETIQFKEFA